MKEDVMVRILSDRMQKTELRKQNSILRKKLRAMEDEIRRLRKELGLE